MKVTSQEVKTIYSIEFDLADFTKIYLNAADDPALIDGFKGFDLEDDSMGYIKECWESLNSTWRKNHAKDLQYIVRKLGFDGIENYGYMKTLMNGKQVYRLTVYNYGEVYL